MNKKIVILIVLIECILSVFLISYLGKTIEKAIKNVQCNSISFVDEYGETIKDGTVIEVELTNTNITYQLYWELSPSRTTNKSVTFSCSKPESVIIDDTGLVTFIDEVTVTISIHALDGSGKSASIILHPKTDVKGDLDI